MAGTTRTPAKGLAEALGTGDVLIGQVPLGQLVPITNRATTPPGVVSNVTSAATDLTLKRTIDGASHITMSLNDASRSILRSGIFAFADVLTYDGLNFVNVAFAKAGDGLQLQFEDALVYNLRQQKGAFNWQSTTDLQGFIRYMLAGGPQGAGFSGSAIPGAKLIAQPGAVSFDTGSGATAASTVSTVAPIARGTTANPKEDSWSCFNRLAQSAGWRLYACESTLYLGSDAWFLSEFPSEGVLREFTSSVKNIDGTFDVGMPQGTLTVTAVCELWPYRPGANVDVAGMGPFDGKWIVYALQRGLYNPEGQMTLQRAMSPEQLRLGLPTLQYAG